MRFLSFVPNSREQKPKQILNYLLKMKDHILIKIFPTILFPLCSPYKQWTCQLQILTICFYNALQPIATILEWTIIVTVEKLPRRSLWHWGQQRNPKVWHKDCRLWSTQSLPKSGVTNMDITSLTGMWTVILVCVFQKHK